MELRRTDRISSSILDIEIVSWYLENIVPETLPEKMRSILLFWLASIFDKFILFSSSGIDNVYSS